MGERDQLDTSGIERGEDEDPGWPIGFLAFVGLAALYLIIRFVQLGVRLFDWLT